MASGYGVPRGCSVNFRRSSEATATVCAAYGGTGAEMGWKNGAVSMKNPQKTPDCARFQHKQVPLYFGGLSR